MKPKERLNEMLGNFYDFLNSSNDLTLKSLGKNCVTLEFPRGEVDVFLHYERKGIKSRKRTTKENSLSHQINQKLYSGRNVANIFYGDGVNFLIGERIWPLNSSVCLDGRVTLTSKEKFLLELQKERKTEKERIYFEQQKLKGQNVHNHPADVLTYITSQEFGGELRSYRMQPIFLRYKNLNQEDKKTPFLNERLALTKMLARRAIPSQKEFEFVPIKQNGRLFVLQPKER